MNKKISIIAFAIGFLVVAWVGFGYIGHSPLALAMTAIIAAVYFIGTLELQRYHRATTGLAQALSAIPDNLQNLGDWLATLPPALQNAVRLRVEGERVGLPGPTITPYLVGLLVLLGMLGTFLGMVVTLNGAVIALESTTDLQTIRASLAAPVKGLGVAFGTSVAGVAASAMLGLISALCRRERLQAGQLLDTRIATVLRHFSLAHQRQATFQALQYQAQALPQVVTQLQAMLGQMEQHQQQLNDRLLANQASHHQETQAIFTQLAAAVDHSLQQNLTASARLAGETIQPLVSATMQGIAQETTALHAQVATTVEQQLNGLGQHLATTLDRVGERWATTLNQQEQHQAQFSDTLQQRFDRYADTLEQRSRDLVIKLEQDHAKQQAELAATLDGFTSATQAQQAQQAEQMATQLAGLTSGFASTASTLAAHWNEAQNQQQQLTRSLSQEIQQSHAAMAANFVQGSADLLANLQSAHTELQRTLAAQDQARQATLSETLTTMGAALQQAWQTRGEQSLAQQERLCQILGTTAQEFASTAQAQTSHTIAEVSRLMETAAAAPRAAAEVIGQLRQELSASMARDNTLLEERSRIMETLSTLLDAINHASTKQRDAIDALVNSSAELLERAGQQFAVRLSEESSQLQQVASQITGGAVEVASLSEAFAGAVHLFGDSNDKLMTTLQRIEAALAKSMTRSDEQLAYYVAQAREIIDLSIMSQKQIVEDLQGLSRTPAGEAA